VATTVGDKRGSVRTIRGVKVVYLPIANLHWPYDRVRRSSARRKLWHLADIYNRTMKARLRRLTREERPDVIHTSNLQGFSVSAWRAAREEKIPVVHTLQDYYLTCGRCTRYHNGRTCVRTCFECLPLLFARRRASICVSGVVGISNYVLQHHLRHGFFPAASFSDVISHDSAVAAPPRVRPGGAPLTFGYFGRLVPEKGVARLIDGFAGRTDTGWSLLIAGEGEERYTRELRRKHAHAQRADAIRFLGWMRADEFFSEIDILILPSLWQEPLARVVGEANSRGIPVIGSARGGIPEAVEDGVTGWLFDPDAPGALGSVVDRLLEDTPLAGRIGANAERRARGHALDLIVTEYRRAYDAVLDTARSRERVRGRSAR
jgi:glycosyltransferase involved in cell wall biosynthesis